MEAVGLFGNIYKIWGVSRMEIKYDECYDCKDEYETPLVKKGDKTLCEDCINWKNTKEEFANSPFALIVK